MSAERTQLALLQGQLANALLRGGALPSGFDGVRSRQTAVSLARKRRRELAKSWPALVRHLGAEFDTCFAAYAAECALPRHGGPLADGRAFADFVAQAHPWSDEVRLEVLHVDFHHIRHGADLTPRRGVALNGCFLRDSRTIVAAVRLPWVGVRFIRIRLP